MIGQATSDNYTCAAGIRAGASSVLIVCPTSRRCHHKTLQLMHTFDLNPTSLSEAIQRLQDCIMEIREWLTSNYLKVNDQKTEFLPIVPVSAKKLI